MFSGIIETQVQVLDFLNKGSNVQIRLQRPEFFTDIAIGDSIAINGICLTVVAFDGQQISFDLGPETLKVTGWTQDSLLNAKVNIERSLQLNSRIHGHFVSGHVDEMGVLVQRKPLGEALELWFSYSKNMAAFIWKKGSVTINGVSLTINEVKDNTLQVTLIPETLRRTNLGQITVGQKITLEADPMARGVVNFMRTQQNQDVQL